MQLLTIALIVKSHNTGYISLIPRYISCFPQCLSNSSAKHILTVIYFQTLYDILYYFTIYGTTLKYLVLLNYTFVFVTYFFGQIESVKKQMKT